LRFFCPTFAAAQRHKRFYNLPWLCAEAACGAGASVTPMARRRYAQGKADAFAVTLHLSPAQRARVLSSLRDDAAFLASSDAAGGLMDYSLIVGAAASPDSIVPPGPGAPHAPPLVASHEGVTHVYYIGLIDFLQTWSGGKKVAHVIKACCAPHPISTVPPGPYAAQFVGHFEGALREDGAEVEAGAGSAGAAAADGEVATIVATEEGAAEAK
jgi:hypothetical protein